MRRYWTGPGERPGEGVRSVTGKGQSSRSKIPPADREVLKLYGQFAKENLCRELSGTPALFGEQLYMLPLPLDLKGLKVLRAGLHVGTCRKNRLEPSHALALALRPGDVKRRCALDGREKTVEAYLRGEALPLDGENGWNLVLVDGYPLGWGKRSGQVLKNHYPKGLRRP